MIRSCGASSCNNRITTYIPYEDPDVVNRRSSEDGFHESGDGAVAIYSYLNRNGHFFDERHLIGVKNLGYPSLMHGHQRDLFQLESLEPIAS